jgi:hypothetical protein
MIAAHPKGAQGARRPAGSAEVSPSLSFFDQFAQDANQRSTSRRSTLLGELLKHEDDPLHFLKDEAPISDIAPPSSPKALAIDDDFNLHQELDPEYFRASPSSTPLASVAATTHEEASSLPPSNPDEALSGAVERSNREDEPPMRSKSYQSLSDPLTSWMSTLLRAGNGAHPQSSAAAKPVLESIFSDPSSTSPSHSPTARESLIHTHLRAASTPTQPRRSFSRSQTFPSLSSSPTSHPVFTHTSAFAPTSSTTLSHGASPFAPHVYIPPTGAPGFKGESYSWDKGFSEELAAEREREEGLPREEANIKARILPDPTPVRAARATVEKERAVDVSSPLAIKGIGSSGWGSGFGFGFTSLRGKGKKVRSARDVVSPSSSSGLSDDAGSSVRRPSPGHSTRSGSASSSRSRLEEQELVSGDRVGKPFVLPNPGLYHNTLGRQMDMGYFIERKTGDVNLLGRKVSTTPVLTPELAGLVRLFSSPFFSCSMAPLSI